MPASTRRSAAPSRHRELRSADDGDEENCVPHHRPRPQQRKPSTHATRRVSLEGAFREITNHYTSGTARGTGTGRGSDKSGKQMSQRAAKLLSHSNSDELTDAIQEVEEWAEALNETRGDEMCDDAFEGLEDDQSDESDYDEVDDDEPTPELVDSSGSEDDTQAKPRVGSGQAKGKEKTRRGRSSVSHLKKAALPKQEGLHQKRAIRPRRGYLNQSVKHVSRRMLQTG